MDFEQIYDQYFPRVYRYLLSLCSDPSLAEELAQDTFYRAIEHSGAFRGECKLSVWLCQIAKNCWLSHMRKEKRRVSYDDAGEAAAPGDMEENLAQKDSALQIHRRLHALPEPYREVFSLRVFAELSFAQIGGLFGKTEVWARVTYYRAKQKLKEDLP